MTRVGDVALAIAIVWMFRLFGTVSITEINGMAFLMPAGVITGIGLLLLDRRHGEIGTDAADGLAAGCHGRPDAGFRADPCGHHGNGRGLPPGADVSADRRFSDRGRRPSPSPAG